MVRSPRAGMSRRHTVIDGDRGRPFPACGDTPDRVHSANGLIAMSRSPRSAC